MGHKHYLFNHEMLEIMNDEFFLRKIAYCFYERLCDSFIEVTIIYYRIKTKYHTEVLGTVLNMNYSESGY